MRIVNSLGRVPCLRWLNVCNDRFAIKLQYAFLVVGVVIVPLVVWYLDLATVFFEPASLSDDSDYLLNTLDSRLTRFAGERINFSSRRCDKLEKPDAAIPCYEPKCPGMFSPSSRERLDQVLATRRQFPSSMQTAFQTTVQNLSRHDYLFVTAASSHYYYILQALLDNVFKVVFPKMVNKDVLLVVFDIGLSKEQRKKVEKHCRCTVLDFPFSELPSFVRSLRCYTWKPMIVASMLEKAEYIVWMDTSIHWKPHVDFDVIFQRTNERGFQVYANGGSMAVRTKPSMTKYFGDHLCQYAHFDEFDANLAVFYNDRFTKEAIIAPWVSCALNQTCMCLEGHDSMLTCRWALPRTYGRCHRFDQAALSIIFTKLLLDYRPMVYLPKDVATVQRGQALRLFR